LALSLISRMSWCYAKASMKETWVGRLSIPCRVPLPLNHFVIARVGGR
jgi:hypothetical protein